MKLNELSGRYVLAVSGGVDSVVLLDLLTRQARKTRDLDIIVAHFDHGIRPDSSKDSDFAGDLAKKYNLKFHSTKGNLGVGASELQSREARYKFFSSVVKQEKADGLITAHHEDDLIETAIINIIRGTGRKGLASLNSGPSRLRPLLDYPKSEIIEYAVANKLVWHEDSTNQDLKYLRNYIRHKIVPRLDKKSRYELVSLIKKQAKLNKEIDANLAKVLKTNAADNQLPRLWLNSLDSTLTGEVLAAWLRQSGLESFDRSTIERLSADLKTAKPSKKIDVYSNWYVLSSADNLALQRVER